MTTPAKLNEYNHAENPARVLLGRLGWTYVHREVIAEERGGERDVLLKGRLRAALMRLNEWMTAEQAGRVIFDLEHLDETGMARNQAVHEYLTYGMPLTVDGTRGRDTRTVRFFDFDHPEGGLNEFVVTTQFRVRRGNDRPWTEPSAGPSTSSGLAEVEDDERVIKPDLALFVNGIPLVVMEAKSPSLLDVWKSQAVRQLRRYQEAGPEWHGTGAPELFHYNLLCVAHCGAAAAYAAPEFGAARELDQGQIIGAFVDPEGEPEALVVVDMLLTGFDAPVEQVLYLDRALREHGLLQAIARVNRRFDHEWDGVPTEKTHGLVVDYHGVSRDLEEALSTFDWPDVQDTMREMDEDPSTVVEAAAVQAESHFAGRDLGDTWECVAFFERDAHTEGSYRADLFERFNADYRVFSRLMDRFLPDPRALDYTDRLARLTEIRAYVRAHFLRENADVDWTEIGAKVKRLVDERISAEVRELMRPVSILDQDFEQKIASLPHDEARASVMEHTIRAQIHEGLAANPAFFEKLSEQLARIIEDLRNRVIDSAEACRRYAEIRRMIRSEADIAAEHGLSPVSFAIYELLDERAEEPAPAREERAPYRTQLDEQTKEVALQVESVIVRHSVVVDWESNDEVKRLMRRDIKRELRPTGDFTEEQLEEMASRIVELARRRSGR